MKVTWGDASDMPNNEAVLGQHLNGSQGNNFNGLPSYSIFPPPKKVFCYPSIFLVSFSVWSTFHSCLCWIHCSFSFQETDACRDGNNFLNCWGWGECYCPSSWPERTFFFRQSHEQFSLWCLLPFFSQDRACVKNHVKNLSFKNYFKKQNFCTL